MPAPARVAFVLAGLGAGGAERVVTMLAQALDDSGSQVTVIAFDHVDDPIYNALPPGVRVIRLAARPGERRGGVAAIASRVWRLRAALARVAPDVVISFLTKINVVTLLATIGTRLPVIACERNNPQLQPMSRVWTRLLDRLYPRAAAIVLQTEASRACLPASVAARASVIPNPVERSVGRSAPGDPLVIAGVGRLDHQKGFDRLLQAASGMARVGAGWQLKIWGEGPLRQDLAGMANDLGIASRVELPGLSEPRQWMADTDIFVLSSRHEGFPNALAEAMAAGLPVVAFDCPFGPGELITHGVDGLLVPDGDIDVLSASIRLLINDGKFRRQLGAAAQQSTERFVTSQVVTMWQQNIASVTKS